MADDVRAIDMVGNGPPERADAVQWARVGRWAAYVGGVGLLTQSVLFLLDSLDLVAPALGETPTGGDADADLAAYFSAWFARQHEVWWNIAVRDTVGPLGLLALVVAVTALVGWLGRRDVVGALTVLLFALGALLSAGCDLVYLGVIAYWRFEWGDATTVNMIASGRAVQAIDVVTAYPQYAGYLLVSGALACLWWLSRGEPRVPRWVGAVTFLEATALPLVVLTGVLGPDTVNGVLALLTGVVLGPALCVGVAVTLSERRPTRR